MKRFLVFVIICIVTLSLGLTTYYFLRDNETIVVLDSYFEVNMGDTFVVRVEHTKPRPTTELVYESLHEDIVYYNPVSKEYVARSGGKAVIKISATRADFNPVNIEVIVGDGTVNAPFFVKSIEDILFIGKEEIVLSESNTVSNPKQFDKSYKLKNDLDFAQLVNLDPVLMENNGINPAVYQEGVWIPIGQDQLAGEGFSGLFDFNNHTIYNMSIVEEDFPQGLTIENAGLFAVLENNAVVRNLNLENVNIVGNFDNAGSVAAVNYGIVETTSALSGDINNLQQDSNTGGLVGKQEILEQIAPRVDLSYSNININCGLKGGGLVGYNHGGIIINSYSKSDIQAGLNALIGGIVGLNQNKEIEVTRNEQTTLVNKEAVVKDTYYYGVITSATDNKGAIIGQNINKDDLVRINIIRGNYYSTDLSGDIQAIGGFLNSEIDEDKIGVFNRTLAELKIEDTYYSYTNRQSADVYWAFNKTWQLDTKFNDGLPILNISYPKLNDGLRNISDGVSINDVSELLNIDMSGSYIIKSNLDLSLVSENWIPIGYTSDQIIEKFNGSLTADIDPATNQPFIISNLLITSNRSVNGLFAHIGDQGVITGLIIENIYIQNGANVGAVAGINDGIIENVKVRTNAVLDNYKIFATGSAKTINVGAIAGVSNGTIDNCYSNIEVYVEDVAGNVSNGGGLAGSNFGSILNSHSRSNITGTGIASKYMGGLAGNNEGDILFSYFLGDITAATSSDKVIVGGIAGNNGPYAQIKNSFAEQGDYQGFAVGGIVGLNTGYVSESYSSVKMTGKYVGGLAFNIKSGTFVNTYSLSFMEGIDSNSIKAGFAYYIEYQDENNYGQVVTSFSASTFGFVGDSYGETFAKVRTEGLLAKRQAGYIKNSIYTTLDRELKEQNYLIDFINTEWLIPEDERKIIVSEEHAKGQDSKSFSTFITTGFSSTIWKFIEPINNVNQDAPFISLQNMPVIEE